MSDTTEFKVIVSRMKLLMELYEGLGEVTLNPKPPADERWFGKMDALLDVELARLKRQVENKLKSAERKRVQKLFPDFYA